uniref:Uncharacterized protein n=1 Tax=Arundo donax TaxID=35708 RepID=A0A0A9HKZ6_ARUDO
MKFYPKNNAFFLCYNQREEEFSSLGVTASAVTRCSLICLYSIYLCQLNMQHILFIFHVLLCRNNSS